MYSLIFLALVIAGGLLVTAGVRKRSVGMSGIGGLVILLGLFFFPLLEFVAEMLWFGELGFSQRFWTVVLARVGAGMGGALLGAVVVWLLTLRIPGDRPASRVWPEALGTLVGLSAGVANWETVLVFLNQVSAGVADPILGRDVGFYMFALPLLDVLVSLLSGLCVIALAAGAAGVFLRRGRNGVDILPPQLSRLTPADYTPISIPLGGMLIVWGGWWLLQRFHLLTSTFGTVNGAGWTDVNVRMPLFLIMAVVSVLAGLLLLVPGLRRALARPFAANPGGVGADVGVLASAAALVLLIWFGGAGALPGLFQWLYVSPNEITVEKPYIEHNIQFTRDAFNVDHIQDRELHASQDFTPDLVDRNSQLLDNVRLWDWRALQSVYRQFQEIRLYYSFDDVDVDRYMIEGDYRQVMVSPREMHLPSLPDQAKTFVNLRFKYTHGYGLAMSPVREFTEDGLPVMYIRGVPPTAEYEQFDLEKPQIYYGTLTNSHVVVNTKEAEFDYPKGDQNAYVRYAGEGGVPIGGLWRKFVFASLFDGTRLFLSTYPRQGSRIMFHRNVRDRLRRVAPFLRVENDPYIVVANRRLYWIIDAYTVSDAYPYSEPFSPMDDTAGPRPLPSRTQAPDSVDHLRGTNYVRNSVKAVVDAYTGKVKLYVYEPDDPVLQVWRNIFPDLFTPKDEMPETLRRHVRYPSSFLLLQGLVYSKYHMTNPEVFYNQEDLWVRATERYYANVEPVEPYYVLWQLPDSDEVQFACILPFTPKNKQVLRGWLAGLSDGQRYGELMAYMLPKERRVLGPQQVETKIDQDRHLSGQLSLWDQRGSRVIRGNLLAIPIEKTLLYVEPIYLQAESAAYPELKLVAVMHNDQLSYAPTFGKAIEGLLKGKKVPEAALAAAGTEQPDGTPASVRSLVRQASNAFDTYRQATGEGRFSDAAQAFSGLQSALQQLMKQTAVKQAGDE